MFYNNKAFFDFAVKFEFNPKNRSRFYIKLGQLLENGVQLDTALKQLQTLGSRSKGSILPILYGRWRRNVANGVNFGVCIAPYVPSSEAILLETGSGSGHLVDSLYNAADTVEQQAKVKGAIIGSAAYPAVLFLMLIAALILASYMVIPTFEEILPVEEWQGAARITAHVTQAIRDYGIILLTTFVLIIVLIGFSMPRWVGRERMIVENIVPWNLYRMWQGSSFLLSIAALMKAGVKLDEVSLNKISKNAEPYLAQRIAGIKKGIVSGENLGEALHQSGYKFPDEELIADLRIYATLRGFDKNLLRITQVWVGDLVDSVKVSMQILNAVVLVLITVVIGFLISSLYGIVQQIQAAT
jgi:type II secretory pathway component PulF